MSNVYRGITSKKFIAMLYEEKVSVSISTVVCMVNDLDYRHSEEQFYKVATRRYSSRQSGFERRKDNPRYFIEEFSSGQLGCQVYEIPLHCNGVYDEYTLESYTVIGTLLKDGKTWFIETNLENIERIRRNQEVANMKAGRLSFFEYGDNYERYIKSLEKLDDEQGLMYVRGHGL